MDAEGRGTNLLITSTLRHICFSCLIPIHCPSFLNSTAVTGLGLDRETGDLAQRTEVVEVAVTMRDVAPETGNVRDDSEPQAMIALPTLPMSIPIFFLVCTLPALF